MLDGRERIVEMVKETLPFLVLVGPPETLRVILEAIPLDRQQVAVLRESLCNARGGRTGTPASTR